MNNIKKLQNSWEMSYKTEEKIRFIEKKYQKNQWVPFKNW
jgi:hypothetical protein